MIAHRRQLIAFLSSCTVLIAAAYLLTSPFPAPSTSLLDPDDPQYRLSPPSSGEYFNVWDPANNVHESHYNGVFQRGGPFDRDLRVGGGRLAGGRKVYRIGNFELGSGAAAQHAYATVMAAIKTAYSRAIAARLARESEIEQNSEISAMALRDSELSSSVRHALASQSRRIRRMSAHTHAVLVNHARAIKNVRGKVDLLGRDQAVEDRRLHVLLNNQHALARLAASAYVKAKSVRSVATRAEYDAAHAQNDVSRKVLPRILSLQRTHNENVAYILRLAHALMQTNALVHDLTFKNMEQIKADIESGAVRQDSLETLISLLTKHTDQRFVKVAKDMKKQEKLVEGVHERMDKVEDEVSDTQDKLKSLKKRVKDDVEKLEKKIRSLGSKAGKSHDDDDEEDEEEEPRQHEVHHFVQHIEAHHHYHHHEARQEHERTGPHSSEHRAQHSSEDNGEHSSEDKGEHSSEDKGEHSSEDKGEHSSEDKGDHSSEDKGEHSSEDKGEHSSEHRAQHSSEDKGEHSSEDKGEHSSEGSSER